MKANTRIKRAVPAKLKSRSAAISVHPGDAGVTKDWIAGPPKAPAAAERGNGYSSNPHGPLKPGDFGVHSHPETAKLPRNPPRTEPR